MLSQFNEELENGLFMYRMRGGHVGCEDHFLAKKNLPSIITFILGLATNNFGNGQYHIRIHIQNHFRISNIRIPHTDIYQIIILSANDR